MEQNSKRDIFFEGRIYVGCDTNADDFAIKYLPTMNYTNHPVHGSHNFTDRQDVTGLYELKEVDDSLNMDGSSLIQVAIPTPLPVKSDDKEGVKEKARDGWVSIEKDGLPEAQNKFGESDYLLCGIEDLDKSAIFVGWYNHKEKTWRLAHYTATSQPLIVTHYRTLPEPPKQ